MTDQAPFRDFDAAWEEQAKTAPSFRAFGKTYRLPKSPPVKVMLAAMRHAQDGDPSARVSNEQVVDIAGLLIGRDHVAQLLEDGITFDQIGDVISYAQQVYTKKSGGGDGGPPAGAATEPPSSPTGTPSRPTSNASTGST